MNALAVRPIVEMAGGGDLPAGCSQDPPLYFAVREWRDRHCTAEQPDLGKCSGPIVGTPPLLLSFVVSKDEEHVHLHAIRGRLGIDLGARIHHSLLLMLARRRLSDRAEGLPESTCGWVYVDELWRDPSMDRSRLNLAVHRIRSQFRAHALPETAVIIERRTDQIRLGVPSVAITIT